MHLHTLLQETKGCTRQPSEGKQSAGQVELLEAHQSINQFSSSEDLVSNLQRIYSFSALWGRVSSSSVNHS